MHKASLRGGERRHRDTQLLLHHAQGTVGRIPAERILARERWVEEKRAADLRAAVVSASEHREEVRFAGDGAGVLEERGEVGAGAPEGELPNAVGVHGHQLAGEVVLDVRVFPARVHDAPVVGHHWRVVTVLLVCELDRLAGAAVKSVEDAHREVTVLARKELVRARAEKAYLVLVRQVACVPPLNVVVAVFRRNQSRG